MYNTYYYHLILIVKHMSSQRIINNKHNKLIKLFKTISTIYIIYYCYIIEYFIEMDKI